MKLTPKIQILSKIICSSAPSEKSKEKQFALLNILKRKTIYPLLFLLSFIISSEGWGQTTRYWVGGASGNINAGSNWSGTSGGAAGSGTITFANNDILIIDANSGAENITITVNAGNPLVIGKLQVKGNKNVTLTNPSNATTGITIGAAASDAFVIEAGSTVILSGFSSTYTFPFLLHSTSGVTANIDGTLRRNAHSTFTRGALATCNFNAGSTYVHNGSDGTLPTATWAATSTLQIEQNITDGSFTQNFGNVVVNGSAGFIMHTGSSVYTHSIQGSFTMNSSGIVTVKNNSYNATLTINGNLNITGSGTFRIDAQTTASSATKRVVVNGDFSQSNGIMSISNASSTTITTNSVFAILEVKGNFIHTAGTLTQTAADADYVARIELTSTNTQTIESTGRTVSGSALLPFEVKQTTANGVCVVPAGKTFVNLGGAFTITNNTSTTSDFTINGTFRRSGTAAVTFFDATVANGGTYEHNTTGASGIPSVTWADGSTLLVSNAPDLTNMNQSFWNITYNNSSASTEIINTDAFEVRNILSLPSTNTGTITLVSLATGRTNSIATLNLAGGTFNMTTSSETSGLTGSVNVSGGTFNMGTSSGAPTITGNVNISGGTFNMAASTAAPTITGNVNVNGGNFYAVAAGIGTVTSTINGNVTISGGMFYVTGNTAITVHILDLNGNLELNNNGVIEFNPIAAATGAGRLYFSGDLTISGGTMQRTQTATDGTTGIYFDGTTQTFTWSGGSLTGAVPNRFYTNGVTSINEIYSSSTAQTTVNGTAGSPAIGSAWPTSGTVIKNLTINNAAGVTLSTTKTVNETLTLANGTFTLSNALTMANNSHIIRSGGNLSAAPSFGANVNVTYAQHTSSITTGVELPDSAAQILNNLTVENSNGVVLNKNILTKGNLGITGQLTCPAENRITVKGSLNNTGTITLQSNSSGTATILTEGSVAGAGTFNVQQYFPESSAAQIVTNGRNWYISSPVSNAQGSVFLAAPNNVMWEYNESTNNWDAVVSVSSLSTGKGYIANIKNDNADSVYTFTGGMFNNGPVSFSNLTYTTSNPKKGYHLIGNPYPSYLNPTSALKDNTTGLEATIWYRTFDGTANAYKFETYNYQSGAGTTGLSKNIPPMQSFWLRVTGGTNSIEFTNAMRNHKQAGDPNLKSLNNNLMRLFLTNTNSQSDEQIILFNDMAGTGFNNWDSEKQMSGNIPQLWSIESGKNLVINSMPEITNGLTIPLFMNIPTAGNHTISFNLNDFDQTTTVWLQDLSLGNMHDIRTGDYNFTSVVVSNNNRFVLVFDNVITGSETIATSSPLTIYSNEDMIYVNSPENGLIQVWDITGRLVAAKDAVPGLNTLQISVANGIYVVRVASGSQIKTAKVVLWNK